MTAPTREDYFGLLGRVEQVASGTSQCIEHIVSAIDRLEERLAVVEERLDVQQAGALSPCATPGCGIPTPAERCSQCEAQEAIDG